MGNHILHKQRSFLKRHHLVSLLWSPLYSFCFLTQIHSVLWLILDTEPLPPQRQLFSSNVLGVFYLGIRRLYQNTAVLVFSPLFFTLKKLPLSASPISYSLSKGGFGLSSSGKTGSKWQGVMETVSWVISCFNCWATKKVLPYQIEINDYSMLPPEGHAAKWEISFLTKFSHQYYEVQRERYTQNGKNTDWRNEWGFIWRNFCHSVISWKAVFGKYG